MMATTVKSSASVKARRVTKAVLVKPPVNSKCDLRSNYDGFAGKSLPRLRQ
jgi:hypothetical protein